MTLTPFSSVRRSKTAINSGFTLIELLVVIAIIAILAAILFPVFAQAREKARQAACLSNTKQLGLGLMQYEQDYDECLPYNYNRYGSAADRWYRAMYPYYKSVGVMVCPSKTDTAVSGFLPYVPTVTNASATVMNTGPTSPGGYGMSYSISGSYYNPDSLTTYSSPPRALADIKDSAGTFAFCDTGQARATIANNTDPTTWPKLEVGATDYMTMPPSSWDGKTNYYAQPVPTDSDNYGRRPMARHNGGLSVIYADGHAKWVNIKNFLGVTPARPNGWPYGDPNNSWDNL